jgi:chromosome segregation ATPase
MTISFLLSLWTLVETPFRAIDEPDVFMDTIYRNISFASIIETSLTYHADRQLIIITPHDVSKQKKDKNIKIFTLHPPQRTGQTNIDDYLNRNKE